MGQINPDIPVIGNPVSTEDAKVKTALETLVATINGLDNANIASNANINASKLLDGSIAAAKLATDAVETAKIKDGSVTTAKIVDAQVTTAKIGDSQVTTAKIDNGAVTNAKLNLSSSTVTGTNTSAGDVEEVAVDTLSLGAGTYLVLFNGYVDFPETVTTCNVRLKRGSTQITLFNPRVPGTSAATRVVLPLSFGELVTLTTSQVISVTVQAPTTGFGSTVGGSLTVLKIA
jgi:hypothetical protein